jgi:O-acetyl-ADP-ribose deacetylase (regulator of RNase III)
MKVTKGDLLELGATGYFDVIVHGCNCQNSMEAGIARSIRERYPEAREADRQTNKGDRKKLGTIGFAVVNCPMHELTIVNAYTQYHYSGKLPLVDYEAIRSAFRKIKTRFSGKRIGYPLIGAGLAGGDWKIIAGIIEEELREEDHTLVEFRQ